MNTNLLITFIRGRYTEVFLRSLPSQTMRVLTCVLTMTYCGQCHSVCSSVKDVSF